MKPWILLLGTGLLGVLLQGCGPVPVERTAPVNEVIRGSESAPAEPQWVQFGIVQWISPATVTTETGVAEEAMQLSILMDTGEELTVVQAVSQAGTFSVGDRVRLLRIGDFTRVTFWPYENRTPQVESPLLMPGGSGPGYTE